MLNDVLAQDTPVEPVQFAYATRSKLGEEPKEKAVVVSLPSIESSFVSYYAKGPVGFADADYPALRIAGEVLNATEGFLWVRGSPCQITIPVSLAP